MSPPDPFPLEGGCDRRFVRYRVETRPLFVHIVTASTQPWVVIPTHTPAVPEYDDREAKWPAESLARRRAVLPAIPAYRATLAR
jgi:hypothetical protein